MCRKVICQSLPQVSWDVRGERIFLTNESVLCTTHALIHIRTHTCMHSYTYALIHTHSYIYALIHICTHTHTHSYIYALIHIRTHTYTHSYIYALIHIHTHTYTHSYIYTPIHIRTHTYMHRPCDDTLWGLWRHDGRMCLSVQLPDTEILPDFVSPNNSFSVSLFSMDFSTEISPPLLISVLLSVSLMSWLEGRTYRLTSSLAETDLLFDFFNSRWAVVTGWYDMPTLSRAIFFQCLWMLRESSFFTAVSSIGSARLNLGGLKLQTWVKNSDKTLQTEHGYSETTCSSAVTGTGKNHPRL